MKINYNPNCKEKGNIKKRQEKEIIDDKFIIKEINNN